VLNRMTLQILKQVVEKPFTNLFPVPHMPDNLGEVLKAAAEGRVQVNPPVEVPKHFRGKIAYDREKCIGCRLCTRVCPANAITYIPEEKKVMVHVDRCCFCAQCTEICPVQCLWMTEEFLLSSYDRKAQVVIDSGKKAEEVPQVERIPSEAQVMETAAPEAASS